MLEALRKIQRRGGRFFSPKTSPEYMDKRFKESIILPIGFLIGVLGGLSLVGTFFVFKDTGGIFSFYSIEILLFALGWCAFIAAKARKILLAGTLLALSFVVIQPFVLFIAGFRAPITWIAMACAFLVSFLVLPSKGAQLLSTGLFIFDGFILLVLNLDQIHKANYQLDQVQTFVVMFFFSVFIIYGLRKLLIELQRRLDELQEAHRLRIEAMQGEVIALGKAKAAADDASKAKSQFLANMSHELRTPLNAIIGYVEIMLGGMVGTFTEKQAELQGYVHNNAKRLLGLINDILDLAKIESGTAPIILSSADPRKVISETVENMGSLAEQKMLKLTSQFSPNLPKEMEIDVKKIQQIVTNLIGNSLKFTNEGGITVEVSIEGSNLVIKVIDTGIGMPPDAAQYIFEMFRQVDNSDTRKYEGTGLGLAITKGLIKRLGGEVQVISELGKGSVFIVTLPTIVPEGAEVIRLPQSKSSN